MGGGGVMRAAAKVAGIGVVNHGRRRGIRVAQPAEQSMIRSANRPVSTIAESQAGISSEIAPVQQVSSEMMDDWDCLDEELAVGGGEPIGRLVFGGVPTLEEAKEATSDLKDALECFLSSPRAGSSSYAANQASSLQLLSSSEHLETNSCVRYDSEACSTPKHAFQAFMLLSESPEAQSVVASIASDPNVWNAVLQNDALTEFLQSQKDDADYQCQESPRSTVSSRMSEDLSDTSEESGESSLSDVMQKIRTTVAEMVNSVSDYLQEIFAFPAAKNASVDENEDAGSTFNIDKRACFVSLAVMAIAVVLLKR